MPLEITSADELPDAPLYVWGFDLARSGWGPFNWPETPGPMMAIKDCPDLRNKIWRVPDKCMCPVIFPVFPEDDVDLLLFNMDRCDIYRTETEPSRIRGIPKGQPRREVPEEVMQETKREIEKDLSAFKHSIVYGFLASGQAERKFKPYTATGMYRLFEMAKFKAPPFVVVAEHGTRWYTEPACGWSFYDDNMVQYEFCHPREEPKKGDWALERDRWGNETVKLQTYKYRGQRRRYKVKLVESEVEVA